MTLLPATAAHAAWLANDGGVTISFGQDANGHETVTATVTDLDGSCYSTAQPVPT